jgi:DNA repair exonuclease SbcCD ATPase subunit
MSAWNQSKEVIRKKLNALDKQQPGARLQAAERRKDAVAGRRKSSPSSSSSSSSVRDSSSAMQPSYVNGSDAAYDDMLSDEAFAHQDSVQELTGSDTATGYNDDLHLDVEFEHLVKELTGWLGQALNDCDALSWQLEAATVEHARQLAQSLTKHRQEVDEWATAAADFVTFHEKALECAEASALSAKEETELEVQVAHAANFSQDADAARAAAASERARLEAMTQDHAAAISRAQLLQTSLSDSESALNRTKSELQDAQRQNSLLEGKIENAKSQIHEHARVWTKLWQLTRACTLWVKRCGRRPCAYNCL